MGCHAASRSRARLPTRRAATTHAPAPMPVPIGCWHGSPPARRTLHSSLSDGPNGDGVSTRAILSDARARVMIFAIFATETQTMPYINGVGDPQAGRRGVR
jgi:hypothetical protein